MLSQYEYLPVGHYFIWMPYNTLLQKVDEQSARHIGEHGRVLISPDATVEDFGTKAPAETYDVPF